MSENSIEFSLSNAEQRDSWLNSGYRSLATDILQEHKLFFHPEKCEFCKEQIEYLGLVILENEVSIDPVKIAEVREWPTLENKMDV